MFDVNRLEVSDILFPQSLKAISDCPQFLYYCGDITEESFEKCVAVVGTRRMTMYGRRVTQKIVQELVCSGITVVSGFMYGIDMTAHETAVNCEGKTIAILPCGINDSLVENNADLAERILRKGGLLISEFEPDFPAKIWTFHKRNRIIAALGSGVVITEATLDSGSLITANFAKKYNKCILSVPGSVFSECSMGCLQLLRDGARAVGSGYDICKELGFETAKDMYVFKDSVRLKAEDHLWIKDSIEYRIYQLINDSDKSISELSEDLDLSVEVVSSKVTLMLLAGTICEENGKFYV
ncbi:DNA protecting protein DprA [candidate division WWE3 bacterium RIFCSPHIGHO2_12_FULL_38_15]|uniref:DNA protecting protein DprA n=1 Tax=candidate division WWE3 bacterium RIFCSPHIGHO2_02_FULL_38_14 TaxID=1802620 RepID=A0A1F4VBQ1_UNCKA|nr:MAG: DNA protecting protein DprA [candidate division WWE3 bacterium RIFCSPHIGHO2_01_FULL_38_45]OGC49008.1 MAG: DNA protecting protein DprA [candidate division WWE3 bacterium RIFCSPHIGHO2_12_FULL_38_15]OGC54619.1 MAG: DNA protecting protein DprA [candidate division WWE3 bacterium RIFCSPLOWO2_01_FULL_37_24]OGC54672.1 MAG: DNA protecting protein DprA [candidate division WWE3 bacterium RIFCSPHIGHO2_02_FULL_38_14]HLB51360.1 DNA-processing protein DprA [Patescibacteria group bacterium]